MLAYRYGFLCHHNEEAVGKPPEWQATRIDVQDFVIWADLQARTETTSRSEGDIVVVGDAYTHSGVHLGTRLKDLDWSDPWPGIDDLGGRFAILFISGSSIRVANDAFGARTLFYSPGRRAIASHACLLADALGAERSESVKAFLASPEFKSRTVGYLPGDLTIYENVFALIPNNYWDGAKAHRYWPRVARRPTQKEEFLTAACSYFDAFTSFMKSRYTPVFGITGGVDSRAGFAPFRGEFRAMTWTHPIKDEEKPIITQIVDKLSLNHVYIEPKENKPDSPIAAAAVIAGGRVRRGRTYVEGMEMQYRDINGAFVRGYGGEILRGFPVYQRRKNVFTNTAMTYTYSTSMRNCEKGKDYLAFCHAAFDGYMQRANYAGLENFGYKAWDLFYWEHRMGTWGASVLSETDPGIYSLVAFNSRPLYEVALGLPDEERLTKGLLNDVVRMYDPDLADIPLT